ncbi:MAG: SWIM zinc finger family protein [Chitinophagales bacterium]
MTSLSRRYLQNLSSERSFKRGQDYYNSDMVECLLKKGNVFTAAVHGTEIYEIEIIIDQEGTMDCECSCPYDWGGICKHIVAVGLAIIHEDYEIDEEFELLNKRKASRAKMNGTLFFNKFFLSLTPQQQETFLVELFEENDDIRVKLVNFKANRK